jgi:threonine synthase
VDGDFDACQDILKALFADVPFARAVDLSAVNSINFARIIAQSVYYFVAAAALGAPARPVSFAVPTGNFGDAFAGYAAWAMGLPIGRILVATNGNDIVARALSTGDYRRGNSRTTQSPAMDIQVASNFERLFFEASGRDAAATAQAFAEFTAGDAMKVPPAILERMRRLFTGLAADEAQTERAMRDTLAETGQRIDPHTAVAVHAAEIADPAPGPLVIVSTAHPAKFPEAVIAATGAAPPPPRAVCARATLPEHIDRLPAEAEAVKRYVRDFALAGTLST